MDILTNMERKSCVRYGTPYQNYNKLTCVCSRCGGILHLRSELLRTIRGSNGFYIKDPNQEKYFYEVVENIQDVATKFWVKVQNILVYQGVKCVLVSRYSTNITVMTIEVISSVGDC